MAVIRLANGSDLAVKLTVAETIAALQVGEGANGFVELPGEEGPIHLRPGGVIAVIEDARRGTAGFRFGVSRQPE
ncbi:MAG TPA: hypothetical protein VG520_01120 [Candidatus Dormibacteraeota bacterium]|jgi:hypothetical protein|nr:hypothetical protein [Candidatus Dormibacteraeota bacterium]